MATKKTTKRNRPEYWGNISGLMRVFGREFESKKGKTYMSYSTSIGSKKEDSDDYDNLYFNVKFKKNEHPDIEGVFIILVKEGFLTLSVDKDGNTYPAVMILDYDYYECE